MSEIMLNKAFALGCMLLFVGNMSAVHEHALQWRIPLYDTMPSKMSGPEKYGLVGFIGIVGYMCYKAITFLKSFKLRVVTPQDKAILLQFMCCAEQDLVKVQSGEIQKLRIGKFALTDMSKVCALQAECMRQEFMQIAQQSRNDATSYAALETMCMRWREAIQNSDAIKQMLIEQS
jgi:hypothetical protein